MYSDKTAVKHKKPPHLHRQSGHYTINIKSIKQKEITKSYRTLLSRHRVTGRSSRSRNRQLHRSPSDELAAVL